MTRMVVVTGLSGAGRSVAAGALEDLGWFVIDNLPADLVPKVGELASSTSGEYERVALVMGGQGTAVAPQIEALREHVADITVVYLEAATDVLVRRYEATRRRHPLTEDQSLVDAIGEERTQLSAARADADLLIDTSELNPNQLRQRLIDHFTDPGADGDPMRIVLESFGFKHGLPLDVDIVLDCRFLPNPHWVEDLRPQTGLDSPVAEYVLEREVTQRFVDHLTGMLDELLPAYLKEGKSYLTIAFGCTGGRHRSVAVTEEMGRKLRARGWRPRVRHRDLNR